MTDIKAIKVDTLTVGHPVFTVFNPPYPQGKMPQNGFCSEGSVASSFEGGWMVTGI